VDGLVGFYFDFGVCFLYFTDRQGRIGRIGRFKERVIMQIAFKGSNRKPKVVVAGASGFIGRALGPALSERFRVVGLSRLTQEAAAGYDEFVNVDLFYRPSVEQALRGAEMAVYLVHSMMPSAHLVQGGFQDLDLLCADNFARAAAKAGVKHIVYVGGLLPRSREVSKHVESRLEVEAALGSTGVPVTTLRAGMIIGPGGSLYEMLARLVRRIPVMICPSWTRTKMQPVSLKDVVSAISTVIEERPVGRRVFDVGGPERISYRQLMRKVADSWGLRRIMVPVPFLTPGLSRLWVSLTTGAPKALAAPLIESLAHDMLARKGSGHQLLGLNPEGIDKMLVDAARASTTQPVVPNAFQPPRDTKHRSRVCTVQRIRLPLGRNASWTAHMYFSWLPRAMYGLVRVEEGGGQLKRLVFVPTGHLLLELTASPEESSSDCHVFRVSGGSLVKNPNVGRLEFRQLSDARTLLVSVLDFEPVLPPWLYRFTQGLVHASTMKQFAGFMSKSGMLGRVQI